MPLVYNPNDPSRAAELTEALNVIPNQWGLINQLGIFRNEYKSQKNILIPRYTEGDTLLVDRNWDERDSTIVGGQRDELSVKVPHFPVKDAITPNDIDGVVSFEDIRNGIDLETVASARTRKMAAIRRALANTLEYARVVMLTTGNVYAPNETLRTSYGTTINWYTEFGTTQPNEAVDLDDGQVNPLSSLTAIADLAQEGFKGGEIVSEYIGLASPEFFDALSSHPYVVDSVKYINFPGISREVLLGGMTSAPGMDARYRTFEFAGITWVRYPGGVGNNRFIPADEAVVFPRAQGLFRTYFAPRNTFADVNTVAKEAYWEEVIDVRGTLIEIEAESNFINFMSQPEAVIRVRNAAA